MGLRNLLSVLVIALLLCGAGCAKFSKKPPRAEPIKFPESAPPAPNKEPLPYGTIRHIDGRARFVLVETDGFIPPVKGERLKCFRDGQEVGIVSASAEQRRQYFTADIVQGELQRGDRVYR